MKKEDVKKKEDLKIQLDWQFDEDSKKLFSLFEKLINQSDIKNVIKFLEFVNKNWWVNAFMKEWNTQDNNFDKVADKIIDDWWDEDDIDDEEDVTDENDEDDEELQELKEKQKRVKEKIDNDKWFQDIIKKILSKKIDISQMDIRLHVIPYWEDTLDTKSLEVSQRIINSETTPLLFVTYLKILKVLQISPFDELEEFFPSMLKKLEKYEFNPDWFKKKFREHLSDVYLLTKKEQDALLNTLAFGWDIEYAYDFYEYFMEELVGKVYTSYIDEKCFPSSIEEIELVENNKSIRI